MLCACCTFGAIYIWYCLDDYTSGVVSMWCCVHVVHMVSCESGDVNMSCIWYYVHVVLCTCCEFGVVYV